jgi:hypothetical protein
MLTLEIATGLGIMVLTIIFHALFMTAGVRAAECRRSRFGAVGTALGKAVLLSSLTVWMFLAIVLEVGL